MNDAIAKANKEINDFILKWGKTTILLSIYDKLADRMIAMPTETIEECEAKVTRNQELEVLYKIATEK